MALLPKYIRALKLLEGGTALTVGQFNLCMGERNGISAVAVQTRRFKDSSDNLGEPLLLDFDVPLNDFIQLCERLTEEQLWAATPIPTKV